MKNLRFIATALLLVLVTSSALLPRGVEASDRMESVENRCVEGELTAMDGSSCAAEQAEQQEPPPTEVYQLRTGQAGVPAALLLIAMAFLSVASGMALGRTGGARPTTADR